MLPYITTSCWIRVKELSLSLSSVHSVLSLHSTWHFYSPALAYALNFARFGGDLTSSRDILKRVNSSARKSSFNDERPNQIFEFLYKRLKSEEFRGLCRPLLLYMYRTKGSRDRCGTKKQNKTGTSFILQVWNTFILKGCFGTEGLG